MEEKQERTVIHVYLLQSNKHYYFGSLASIYDMLSTDDIGIAYSSLRNVGLSIENPYENKKCIIRKGVIFSKKGNRGRKANNQESS